MRFALFGNTYQAKKSLHAEELFRLLEQHRAEFCISREFHNFLTQDVHLSLPHIEQFDDDRFHADMVISLGGDGTFLKAASRVGSKGIPILGINTGRLGFLADISPEEMRETFNEIYDHRYRIEERSVLQLKCDNPLLTREPYALNEIAVLKRDSSSMISIDTSVNGEMVHTYMADGLLVSTPTGSTAYSMSVGGPILVPQVQGFVLSPVSSHSLNVRPLLIPDSWCIDLEVHSRNGHYLVSVDGRSRVMEQSTRLHISKADYTIRMVKQQGYTFFDTLKNKLMWGVDKRNG